MRCSKVRATMLVMLIGRYDDGAALLPTCLYSAMTLASRHARGVTEKRHENVKMVAIACQQSFPAYLRKTGRVLSGPGAESVC